MDDSSAAISRQAILAALASNWDEALKLNQQIINKNPDNVEALNRLARAYFELGNLIMSKKYFETSLKKDPYNQIATKFIKRITAFRKRSTKNLKPYSLNNHNLQIDNDLFIEEPGKTKIITLLKVAEPQKLSVLFSGLTVLLVKKNRSITVTDQDGEYLGIMPDDVSHRLLRLISGGNKYQAHIKNIKPNSLSILVREVFRSRRFKNQPSFLETLNTFPNYSSNVVLHRDADEKPVFSSEEDGEEIN